MINVWPEGLYIDKEFGMQEGIEEVIIGMSYCVIYVHTTCCFYQILKMSKN